MAASLISPWLLWWPPAESHYNIYDHSVVGYVSHAHSIVLLYSVGNKITTITTTSPNLINIWKSALSANSLLPLTWCVALLKRSNDNVKILPWASCQIRKIAGCACAGNAGNVFPATVPWCRPGSLTSGFLWSRWRGKRSRHSRRMRKPQFYVSGKRPTGIILWFTLLTE